MFVPCFVLHLAASNSYRAESTDPREGERERRTKRRRPTNAPSIDILTEVEVYNNCDRQTDASRHVVKEGWPCFRKNNTHTYVTHARRN